MNSNLKLNLEKLQKKIENEIIDEDLYIPLYNNNGHYEYFIEVSKTHIFRGKPKVRFHIDNPYTPKWLKFSQLDGRPLKWLCDNINEIYPGILSRAKEKAKALKDEERKRARKLDKCATKIEEVLK